MGDCGVIVKYLAVNGLLLTLNDHPRRRRVNRAGLNPKLGFFLKRKTFAQTFAPVAFAGGNEMR